jgi:glutathione S-transferase
MPHILRSSPASPFGRKVKIAAYHTGLMSSLEVVQANTTDPEDSLRTQNPLGKIPILILSTGQTLYDSRVILEWIDTEARSRSVHGIIPQEHDKRFAALTLQALSDGIMDAAILQVYEVRMREPQERSAAWAAHQKAKVNRALSHAESLEPSPIMNGKLNVGQIALACALEYLDLRFADDNWRADYPALSRWLRNMDEAMPALAKTRMVS